MLPTEIEVPIAQVCNYDENNNQEDLSDNLDLLEEWSEMATIREALCKQQIAKYYN